MSSTDPGVAEGEFPAGEGGPALPEHGGRSPAGTANPQNRVEATGRFHLFVFEVVDPGRKSRFYKRLSGRTIRKGGREYRYGGLLSKIRGWRWLAKSALMVPEEEAGRVRNFLGEFDEVIFEEFLLTPVAQSRSGEG